MATGLRRVEAGTGGSMGGSAGRAATLVGPMPVRIPQPWFASALEHLDLGPLNRLMVIQPAATPGALGLLARTVTAEGDLLAAETDELTAATLLRAEIEPVRVVPWLPRPNENHGVFDALLVAPPTMPADVEAIAQWTDHLRPGGRFAFDLPATNACEELTAAWRSVAGADAPLDGLVGVAPEEFAEALHIRGLRKVQTGVGTHLAEFSSAAAVTDACVALVTASDPDREIDVGALSIELTRRLKTLDAVQLVFHRTSVHGIR